MIRNGFELRWVRRNDHATFSFIKKIILKIVFIANSVHFNPKILCFCFTVAPIVSIERTDKNWYVGQTNVKFTCGAKANPPARRFTWIRSVAPSLSSHSVRLHAQLSQAAVEFNSAIFIRQSSLSQYTCTAEESTYEMKYICVGKKVGYSSAFLSDFLSEV